MKKIKLLALLMAALLMFSCALCGCNSDDEPDTSATNSDTDNTENDGDLNIGSKADNEVVNLPSVISDINTSYMYTDLEGRFTVAIPYVFSVYNENNKTLDSFYMESPEGDATLSIRVMDVMSIWDAKGDLKDKYPDGEFLDDQEIDSDDHHAFFKEEVVNGTTTYAKVLLNEEGNQAYIVEMSYPDVMYEYFEELIYEIDLKLITNVEIEGTIDSAP